MKRTRAQRRWMRKGYTHEVGYWSARGKPWDFILVLRPDRVPYFRRHATDDDFVRPICQQFLHNGRKP